MAIALLNFSFALHGIPFILKQFRAYNYAVTSFTCKAF